MILIPIEEGKPIWPLNEVIYRELKCRIDHNLPTLPYGVRLDSGDIYGNEDWAILSTGMRKMIGRYISVMVRSKDIPFTPVLHRHEYPKYYERV